MRAHWLFMIAGQKTGHRYKVSKGQGTIGRGSSNTIQVFDAEVSRIHCRYNVVGDRLDIADLDSSNGTFVNGLPVDRCELSAGDVLKIGSTVFELRIGDVSDDESYDEEISETDFTIHGKVVADDSPSSLSYFPVTNDLYAESLGSEKAAATDSIYGDTDPDRMVQIVSDMSFIYHASLVTSSKSDRDEMLESLVDLIFKWVAADRCCVLLRENGDRKLSVKAFRTRSDTSSKDKLLISQSIVDYVRKKRVGILTSNAMDDQRLSGDESVRKIGIQEAICVPIHGRDQLIGLIYIDALDPVVDSTVERFNKDHLKLMIAIGLQIGFAIEHEQNFARLFEQQRLATIGQTTTSLSHHMKNVLQGVNGGAHLVETGIENKDLDLIEKGWEIVNRNQHEISRLVNDMLIVGQPYDPHLVPADLNLVITDVFKEIAPVLSRRNIHFDWNPSSEPIEFKFDSRGIHWALYNLINSCASACVGVSNAQIRVLVDRTDETVEIRVADNGNQANVKNAEDVFSATKTDPDNKMNPVELAVSRKLILGHAGEINITHPKSGGNLFTIKLPREPSTSDRARLTSST